MAKIKVNTNPVANGYRGPNEHIIEYSSEAGGGLIGFHVTDTNRLLVDLYRHDPTVDVRVGRSDGMPPPTAKVLRTLDLSTAHLPFNVAQDLNGFEGVSAYEHNGEGWLLYVPEDIDGVAGDEDDDEGEDVVPDAIVAIWRYAKANDCRYVLLDRDAEVDPNLPTYDW